MKTPMQEHIEWLDIQWGNAKDCGEKTIDFEIAMKHAESLLEKEKEVMCEFAEYTRKCGFLSDQRGLMTTEELYDQTFNTKEK
jgi:hypothetical protein